MKTRMYRFSVIYLLFMGILIISCEKSATINTLPTTIAFGSCADENLPQPILDVVNSNKPDIFIYLGDNIYGDTQDMNVMREMYGRLGNKPGFQLLKLQSEILATWDDHDYGANDIGKYYSKKEESKAEFLRFFDPDPKSNRLQHAGIYDSKYYTNGKKTLQIILLDERTFRNNLRSYDNSVDRDPRYTYRLSYSRHRSKDSTFLGVEQWEWLEKELQKPADLRLICSGSQFGIEFNGYESWVNFPHEQEKLIELIKKHKAKGVMFLSGDPHYGEFSKMPVTGMYPIYDLTSSGITETWKFATPNVNRIQGPVMENNYGLLTIDWQSEPIRIKAELLDVKKDQRAILNLTTRELSFESFLGSQKVDKR
ncbi:MAG: alkaline phosphatase D family protein [Leadbetterella sp.]